MKAILILDEMPDNCDYCRFLRIGTGDGEVYHWCCATVKKGMNGLIKDETKKPKWCPLTPMPARIGEGFIDYEYGQGWDDCLKELEK